MIQLTEGEIAYRARIAEYYAELSAGEKQTYCESLGISRQTMNYWKEHYSKYATTPRHPKAAPAAEEPAARRRSLPSIPVSMPWMVDNIELRDRMRVISVIIKDRREIQEPKTISARAEFKNGSIAERSLAQLAKQVREVLKGWGYNPPSIKETGYYISREWR